MKKTGLLLTVLLCICASFSSSWFALAGAESALEPSNLDFSDDFEGYAVGTAMSSLEEDYTLFNSADETVAVDPLDSGNQTMHIRVASRMQFEFNGVIARNFTITYRFLATRRTEWIGLNVRRQLRGPASFYDTMQSYLNLIRIGYTLSLIHI